MTFLNPVLTIRTQITEALKPHHGMQKKEARSRTAESLDRVGVPKAGQRLEISPISFSGGIRQRAMIAMTLSCKP